MGDFKDPKENELEQLSSMLRALLHTQCDKVNRERWEIAARLHDRVLQVLNAANLVAEKSLMGRDDRVDRSIVEDVRTYILQAIECAQSLSNEISSPVLKYLGLESALKWLGEEIEREWNMKVSFEKRCECDSVSPQAQSIIFQSLLEMLRELKECGVEKVRVSLRSIDGSIEVSLTHENIREEFMDSTSKLLELSRHRSAQTFLTPSSWFSSFIFASERCRHAGGDVAMSKEDNSVKWSLTIPESFPAPP